jgi:serine/threonine protein kinase/dipeptidyl aminopeptidase/acylaminoacyl peptidase
LIGETLGHFRISALLGEGGMGAVYRAEDTRLGRDVAIKVLPEEFTASPERLARFEREAQVIASLNHPNICALYDVGMAQMSSRATDGSRGISDGSDPSTLPAPGAGSAREDSAVDEAPDGASAVRFLVMELVEGESLQERIERGLAPAQAIAVALQIAGALEAAHAKGIVHRDLKPANVMLTAAGSSGVGQVKVLDFGLAKAWDGPREASPNLTNSPTLTAQMTQAGVILGTAAYMSPEQARGEEADQRADIWSWGVILYEMLVGEQLFAEPTVSDTLAAVLRADFDWEKLPSDTPRQARTVLRRCLERDPYNRLHAIGDARIELTREQPAEETGATASPSEASRKPLWIGAAVGLAGLLLGVLGWTMRPPATDLPVRVTKVVAGYGVTTAELSPDGERIVIDQLGRLVLRELDSPLETAIPGATEVEARLALFWSPDGSRIGYATPNEIYTVGLDGEPPIKVCDIPAGLRNDGNLVGATFWGPDKIVFALDARGLWEVPSRGGEPQLLAAPDRSKGEQALHRPAPLPDGRTLMAKVRRRGPDHTFTFLRDGERTDFTIEGWDLEDVVVAPSGYLIFIRRSDDIGVWAVPFSFEDLRATSDPIRLLAGQFNGLSLGDGGSLLAVARGDSASQVVKVDREGTVLDVYEGIGYARDPAVSPDGSRLAVWGVEVHDGERVVDLTPGFGTGPTWSPDGREILFEEDNTLWRVAADGTREPELVTEDGGDNSHWSPDGRYVAFATYKEKQGEIPEREAALSWTVQTDIILLPLDGGEPIPFRASEDSELYPRFSPDGKFMAYGSDRSGQMEVYVTTFPDGERRWQVSDGGGRYPRWSPAGNEIFYVSRKSLMAAAFSADGDDVDLGAPVRLISPFENALSFAEFGNIAYDVTPEGHFAVLNFHVDDDQAAVLVQNWPGLLERAR